ncbi:Transport and Golgi organization protein 2-like protein [Smittium mucronatum]|uniref:Transport and Golgi organization protein 2-like protein n=1 Tax=Smittium mucronatum TaxID=133383 RepID=A0A1R0GMV1_9FUNG|nr:Transport and Golgi organization protein 2-like protein [Smittium mucronatum]
MCIVFWKLQNPTPDFPYKFVFAGNRDEFFGRATRLMKEWEGGDKKQIVSPLDLQPESSQRGTWLGINEDGRVSFLTNFREKDFRILNAKSRGTLVKNFLDPSNDPDVRKSDANSVNDEAFNYLNNISMEAGAYSGFNLVALDLSQMTSYYLTNRNEGSDGLVKLENSKLLGLSNSYLGKWPKVDKGIDRINKILRPGASVSGFSSHS